MEPGEGDLAECYQELLGMMKGKMECDGQPKHADLCEWFQAEYSMPILMQNLAAELQQLERDCLQIGPVQGKPMPVTVPYAPIKLPGSLTATGHALTLRLWHFGFEEAAGVKGSPCLCDVFEVCKKNLMSDVGNDTEKFPITVLFELLGGNAAGTALQNFSVGLQVGFGTTYGSLLTCLAAIQFKWLDKFPGMAARLLKCLQLESLYRPCATIAQSISEGIASKIQATVRQRPNPMQLLYGFDRLARDMAGRKSPGEKLVSVINSYNKKEQVKSCRVTAEETSVIMFLAMALDILSCAHRVAQRFLVGVLAR